jgi:hypothetical protein
MLDFIPDLLAEGSENFFERQHGVDAQDKLFLELGIGIEDHHKPPITFLPAGVTRFLPQIKNSCQNFRWQESSVSLFAGRLSEPHRFTKIYFMIVYTN